MPSGCGAGWRTRPRNSTATRPAPNRSHAPMRVWPLTTDRRLLLELLVDPLAVGADRRSGLCRLRHRKHLTAQCDDMRPHDGTLGDLVLLHVVEELRRIIVGPVVDLFVGLGALDGLGVHDFHLAWVGNGNKQDSSPARLSVADMWNSGKYETRPRAEFRRRWSTGSHHACGAALRRAAP